MEIEKGKNGPMALLTSKRGYFQDMSSQEEEPPGHPFKIYQRTDNGGRTFMGVAIHLGSHADEVSFRWAASRQVRTVSVAAWNAWEKEASSTFRVRLTPKTS